MIKAKINDLDKKPGLLCSERLNLAFVMFFGCVLTYALRTNLNVAIACMANAPSIEFVNETKKCESNSTFINFIKDKNINAKIEYEFDWSKNTQGNIIGSFYYGYMASQILGGYLAKRIGPKFVIGFVLFSSALFTFVSPAAARLNVYALIVIRILLGFVQGTAFPAMLTMWALWAPPLERGLLTGVSYAGSQIGNVIVMPLAGFLCKYSGWPSIFYLLGCAGLIWCIFWVLIVADSPQKHRRISKAEKEYITNALNNNNDQIKESNKKLPLLKILTSKAVWACFIGHFAGDWGSYAMSSALPIYFKDVLGLDSTSLGMLSAIPYMAYFIMINVSGSIADYVQMNNILSTLNTRRFAMIIGLGGQALCLILITFVQCGQELLMIILIIISLGVSGFQYSGFVINYLDICPDYAGIVVGIGQTISCAAGFLSAKLMGFMTEEGSTSSWNNFFYLNALVLIIGTIIFSLFASDKVQTWTDSSYKKNNRKKIPPIKIINESLQNEIPTILLQPLIKSDKNIKN